MSKLHEAKHHVNVRRDMDEMDLTAAESKATYEEIKKYVAEHNDGMKKIQLMLLSLRTLGIKPDVRRLFVHDNRMFAERAFYCIQKNFSQI